MKEKKKLFHGHLRYKDVQYVFYVRCKYSREMFHGRQEVVAGFIEMQGCSECLFIKPDKCSTAKKKLFHGHLRNKDVLGVW